MAAAASGVSVTIESATLSVAAIVAAVAAASTAGGGDGDAAKNSSTTRRSSVSATTESCRMSLFAGNRTAAVVVDFDVVEVGVVDFGAVGLCY